MNLLTDKEIREALRKRLERMSPTPRAVLEEVRVHNGNAVADVVSIHRSAHCYEIKGQTDAIQRILRQGSYYDQAFQKITLVTTENHLLAADRLAPSHWGILLVKHSRRTNAPIFRYVRKATDNPYFNKQTALLTLWRTELLSLCKGSIVNPHKMSRQNLTEIIAGANPAYDINEWIGEKLAVRRQTNLCPWTI